MKVNHTYFFLKSAVLVLILAILPLKLAIPACLVLTWCYQYFVALVFGLKVMPTMDLVCFFGDEKARVNFESCTIVDNFSFDKMKEKFLNHMKLKAKLRYCIKEVMGDLYYQETNP